MTKRMTSAKTSKGINNAVRRLFEDAGLEYKEQCGGEFTMYDFTFAGRPCSVTVHVEHPRSANAKREITVRFMDAIYQHATYNVDTDTWTLRGGNEDCGTYDGRTTLPDMIRKMEIWTDTCVYMAC